MKSNQISIFIVLILSVVIGGLLYFLERSSDDDLGWNPNEMYGELGARSYDGSSFTNATLSGASNGGVALSMPHTSFSIRTRVSPTTYSPSPIAHRPSPITNIQSPIANGPSPIAYMTSGAEYHSFGGGGNGNMGSAGTFRASAQSLIANSPSPISNSQSPIANSPSPIANSQSPIAYTPSPIANSPSPISNTPATVASGNNPAGLFSYALQTSYGTASYEDMYGSASNRRINGAMRLPGSGGSGADDGFADTWLAWLANNAGEFSNLDGDGYGLNYYALQDAYNAWLQDWMNETGLTEEHAPSFWNFFDWFWGSLDEDGKLNFTWRDKDGNDQTTSMYWVPVGSVLPLLLMGLLYVIILFVKRNKSAQL